MSVARFLFVLQCVVCGLLVGCPAAHVEDLSDGGVDVEASEQGLVNVFGANPPLVRSTSNAMPIMPSGPANAWSGSGQTGFVLNVAPTKLVAAGVTPDPWLDAVVGDGYCTPSTALSKAVKDAIAKARTVAKGRTDDWSQSITDLNTIISLSGGNVPAVGGVSEHSSAYMPERARWLDATKSVGANPSTFNDPPVFAELQHRGLLTYCAATAAFNNGGGKSQIMGHKSLATLNILGAKIDFMGIEPTVLMSAPRRQLETANDGAQAFTIPLAVGVRVSPISLLPSLPEVRTPAVLVMAEAAALAQANVANNGGSWEQWQTATHADAFISAVQSATIAPPKVLLFMAGPFPVYFKLKIVLSTEPCSQASKITDCQSNRNRAVSRVLRNSPYWPVPTARSGGVTTSTYKDSAGFLLQGIYNDDSWDVAADSAPSGYAGYPSGYLKQWRIPLTSGDPISFRAWQDNDKSLEVRTNTNVTGTLSLGDTDVAFPPFTFTLGASGSIAGDATMVHSIREQVGAVTRATAWLDDVPTYTFVPETSLSVTPKTEVSLHAGFDVTLKVKLDLPWPIGTHTFTAKLVNIPDAPIANYASKAWPEDNRLRIGVLQEVNGNITYDDLTSHWPRRTPFPAQPVSVSVCQVGTEAPANMTGPCGPIKSAYPSDVATTSIPGELCAFAQQQLSPDQGWPNAIETACRLRMLTFVNNGAVKANQYRRGFYGTARVLDDQAPSTWTSAFNTALKGCAADMQGMTQAAASAMIDSIVDIGLCSPSAIMYDETSVMKVSSPSVDGPTTGAPISACTCSGSNCP